MTGRRRLWVVSRVFPPDEGGVQTYARAVADGYAALGWRVTVFAKSSAGPSRTEVDGVTVIDVGPGKMAAVYLRLFLAMRRCRRSGERPAVIHACTWRAALAALPLPGRLIVAVHGREIGRPKGAALRLMRHALRRAARVVAVSDATRALLLSRLPELDRKCVVAWNGAAASPALGGTPFSRGEGPAALLTVCRLVERKNVRTAIEAAARAHDRGADFVYRIAGRGPEEEALRAAIRRRGLEDRVEALGFVDDDALRELYRASDIFLHPQIALEDGAEVEGFGISVADAMARGLACIVGGEGGPAELIRDGVTGFVVDGRSPDAVTEAIDRLARSPDLRARMGDEARRWSEANLSWRRHCEISVAGLADAIGGDTA